jgi:hypothetical protein
MKVKKVIAAIVVAAVCALSSVATAAPITTDIVFIVDESGSMGDVQANLRNNIGLFASILSAGGDVDARYALVGYGNNAIVPRLLTDFTNPAAFALAAQNLVTNGGTEPAFAASAFALNEIDGQSSLLSFRANSLKNLIILTDEPSNGDGSGLVNGSPASFAIVDQLLTANNALYNAVLRNGNTIASIGGLATGHNGQVFDLNGLNTTDQQVVQEFVNDFATAKLQETIDFCTLNPTAPGCSPGSVPEPATLSLLAIGLAGVVSARKRHTRSN